MAASVSRLPPHSAALLLLLYSAGYWAGLIKMSPLSFIDPAWAQLAELVTELASEGSKKAVQNMNLHISLYLVRCQLVCRV